MKNLIDLIVKIGAVEGHDKNDHYFLFWDVQEARAIKVNSDYKLSMDEALMLTNSDGDIMIFFSCSGFNDYVLSEKGVPIVEIDKRLFIMKR